MKVRVILKNHGQTGVFEVNRHRCIIGRNQADLTLYDPYTSQQHAMLLTGGNGVLLIRDLGSRNGVFVNDKKVLLKEVRVGDRIKIGSAEIVILRDCIASRDEINPAKVKCPATLEASMSETRSRQEAAV